MNFSKESVLPPPAVAISGEARRARQTMNRLGKAGIPFLFILDFCLQKPLVFPLSVINNDEILFDIQGFSNAGKCEPGPGQGFFFDTMPPTFKQYQTAFHRVIANLLFGNSYLLNLTQPTAIETNISLKEIFFRSQANYKLWIRDKIVVFSPEMFVKITNGCIESHPMKGTIDASIPNAREKILADPKEMAEHNTIVDLIRNDLNRIARNVRVEKFRYITEVQTHQKKLLQVSSCIAGELESDYQSRIGDLMFSLLPAGSISGAPKKKTIEIILEAEQYDRGYYTGVFGCFDGHNFDSGVMIRFIENINGQLWFKSGGGITVNSRCEDEYQELIDKVYLPFT